MLVLLREAGDRPPADPPRADAIACIQAQSRLHALDFWLRNPDYLAFELLELNNQDPDPTLIDRARELIANEDRQFPMLRHLFGAYSELDAPLNLLRCYELAWDVRRPASMRRRRDIYLLQKGEDLLTSKFDSVPELAYYADRASWVARVAGARHGRELKDFQKRLATYREIRWRPYRSHPRHCDAEARRPRRRRRMTDWIPAVAERSRCKIEEAKEILDRHGVQPWVAPPQTPPLTVGEVAFEGTKPDGSAFSFAWAVGRGLWAMSSIDNDVGKSSVLAVIRWLLSGRDRVDAAVRNMIGSARLQFTIDDEPIKVEIAGRRGEERGSVTVGDSAPETVGPASFEAVMDAIVLDRLALRPVARWQKYPHSQDGQPSTRDWTSFIPALFFPEHDSDSLLGSAPTEAGMLLQVFLGLPWYSTHRQADVALKFTGQQGRDAERRADRDREADRGALEAAQQDLRVAQQALAALPSDAVATARLQSAAAGVNDATRRHVAAQQVAAERQKDADGAARLVTEARRSVVALQETVVAGAVFSELKAELCPRCELTIDDDRRNAEAAENVCSVCNRPHGDPQIDAVEALAGAETRLTELEQLHAEADARAAVAADQAGAAAADLLRAQKEHGDAQLAPDLLQRRINAEINVARADGRMQELRRRGRDEVKAEVESLDDKVLKAAKKEAEHRMADTRLLAALDEEVLKLAHLFGMKIDAVKIDRRGALPVMKGEVRQNFGGEGGLTPSEKLRLRVATVIAMLRVARPISHPGLIVIDSPAGGEVALENLGHMLEQLEQLTAGTDRVQVLLATTRTDAVAAAIPQERVRFVPKGQFLW